MGIETGFFEVDGVHLTGGASLYSGSNNPIYAMINLPLGSLYLCTDATLWRKVGTLAHQWIQISGPSAIGSVSIVKKTSSQVSSSITYIDITELSIAVEDNATYRVESYIVWESALARKVS